MTRSASRSAGATRSGGWPGPSRPELAGEVGDGVQVARLSGLQRVALVEERLLGGRRVRQKPPSPGTHAHDRDNSLRELEGGVEGDHPAAAVAHQRRAPNSQGVQDRDQVGAVAEVDVLGGRLAEAAVVVAHDPVLAGQPGNHRVPGPVIRDRGVDQDDRRPLAVARHEQAPSGTSTKRSIGTSYLRCGLAAAMSAPPPVCARRAVAGHLTTLDPDIS